ncbi:hypothetical protein NX02_03060 [Sphingomonas sanxanigenens DSM 19645 = NX02]|uniref:Cadherin domain-containing protein n=2 Tax=Sphingomonas sanxanigenens TaxID=397260 RepID=W0A7A9_9SPHN|nr:hypothetical protein NX02_03060 [Sphingomonas sanxanigenens DSM 19645 = NX02]
MAALALLASCGGGDDDAPPAPPPAPNQAPRFTSAATARFEENGADIVYRAAATDAEGSPVTFSIAGGADAARFAMEANGELRFAAPPNFDLPGDADADNVYEVQLQASDGSASSSLALRVSVTNSTEGVTVRRIATGFVDPVAVAPTSQSLGVILVAQKNGAIYRVTVTTGAREHLITIPNVGGVGVVAIAAGQDYAGNGRFYVMYATGGGVVLGEFGQRAGGPVFQSDFRLISVPAPDYAGGGWIAIDGRSLMVGLGDGGGTGDPTGSAQNDVSPLGKIIRFDPNPDPYAGASPNFYLSTVIAKGLHRPVGGNFHASDAWLVVDAGEDVADEATLLQGIGPGKNFGWPFKEGSKAVRGAPPSGLVEPALEHPRTAGGQGSALIGVALNWSQQDYVLMDRSGAVYVVPRSSVAPGAALPLANFDRRTADFVPDQGKIDRPVQIQSSAGSRIYIVDGDGDIFEADLPSRPSG